MRVTAEHWKRFLEIAEENPELITNQFCGSNGKAKLNALWQSVVNSLNSLGYGEKSVTECRKAVTDWKSKTKTKASKIKLEQSKTGGGSTNIVPLNKIEEQLFNLMGKTAVDGDGEVAELGLESQVIFTNILVLGFRSKPKNRNVRSMM
ncbi:hypothetical protein NQ314_009273 [Rhamnusium bicolor]|uniref:Regulatory protein zeste n=1 Tax=Rhamnusium bicolor TaxID=1586634 RepID=A0AAV8Y273_9CUCU|nr:hypothetical protein NQ314_009273 [Rhamnusium bicolor]